MMCSNSSRIPATNKKKKQIIRRNYWMISLGVVLLFSGYVTFLGLQSSIHIENGLGTKLTTITYASQISINFFLGPFILRLIGTKKTLFIAEASYIVYVALNVTSHPVLMIIGAVVAAFAEATFWLAIGASIFYFAQKYHKLSSKSKEDCIMDFSGIIFGPWHLNMIIGNVLTSAILNAFNSSGNEVLPDNIIPTNSSTMELQNSQNILTITKFAELAGNYVNSTDVMLPASQSIILETDSFRYCGANDCQDPNITQDNIEQYVPSNPVALYVLMGCLVLLMIIGVIIHLVLLPEIPLELLHGSRPNDDEKEEDEAEDEYLNEEKNKNGIKSILKLAFQSVKDTTIQFFHPKQICFVTCLSIYGGLAGGFLFSDVPRAYASCVLGVSEVSLCMIIYATSKGIMTSLVGKIFGKKGRLPLIIIALVFDLSIYTFCLLWEPNEETAWAIYVLFALFGVSQSLVMMVLATVYGSDQYKSKEVSYNIWCITFSTGFAIQSGISTLLCVNEKLYMLIIFAIISCILMSVREIIAKREKKHKSHKENNMIY